MGMRIHCDADVDDDECGNDTFHLDVDLFRDDAVGIFGTAVCTECGNEQEIGTG